MSVRRNIPIVLAAWVAAGTLLAHSARAELKLPRVSPKSSITQTIGLTDITVTYSRPGVKGRVIWGELVPYDEPWRTGANEATSFTASREVKIEGEALPAGTYSLFTIPRKKGWTVVFNREKDLWGAFEYKPEQDALRIDVQPESADHVEWMSFGFEDLKTFSGKLVLRWEKLRVPLTVEVSDLQDILTSARTEVAAAKADDWRTAHRAASFCFDAGVNLDEAERWAKKSVAVQENFYNLTLMAKMHAQAGKKKEAVAAAQRAVELGKKSEGNVDTRPTERLIAEWSGKKM